MLRTHQKRLYKDPPRRSRNEAAEKHETEAVLAKIGIGNIVGVALDASPPYLISTPSSPS
jgi:hypothetical protein